MATPRARAWRAAFGSLRDSTVTSSSPSLLHALQYVLSQTKVLVSAAPDLSTQEVAADIMLLVELTSSERWLFEGIDRGNIVDCVCHLIFDLTCRTQLELKSSSLFFMINFLRRIVERSCDEGASQNTTVQEGDIEFGSITEMATEALQILAHVIHENGGHMSSQEVAFTLNFLLRTVSCHNFEVLFTSGSTVKQRQVAINVSKSQKIENKLEVQILVFIAIGNVFARAGSAVSKEMWQSAIEALRKVMDFLASKSQLVEDNSMSRYYAALLRCLHLVLSDPKGSLREHVPGFVAALRMFFTYGLTSNLSIFPVNIGNRVKGSCGQKSDLGIGRELATHKGSDSGPYRPPHLRGKTRTAPAHTRTNGEDSRLVQPEASGTWAFSSDSELSDGDGSSRDGDRFRSSKARVAAILSIQALCRADPKSLHAQWAMLLPTHDVLQPRRYQATLMTCLLFDPVMKTRMAAAATLAAMLEGNSSVFLQVAEYKDNAKAGSFTTLSSSLGQIIIQLHAGLVHLILNESHSGMLMTIFKALSLLVSAVPFSRLPAELIPNIISSVLKRAKELFLSLSDQSNTVAAAISCLGATLSTVPPSPQVAALLAADVSSGFKGMGDNQTLLSELFLFSQPVAHPSICFEALQALRAAIHNYPSITSACWDQISSIVLGVIELSHLNSGAHATSTMFYKGSPGQNLRPADDKTILSAIKVLDEYLRAVSGFKGTDDLLDDGPLNPAFVSVLPRPVRSLSVHSTYRTKGTEGCEAGAPGKTPGSSQWLEALNTHLPPTLVHPAPMVRAAALTCFAGSTSSVFFSLPDSKQTFIISSIIKAASKDEIPSVRSAACRAIGVIASFPQISASKNRLEELVNVVISNTLDTSVSVRITASWALANICDSLRHNAGSMNAEKCPMVDSPPISLLAECALRLSKDGDKIKANAVRALGNLARFVKFMDWSPINSFNDSYGQVSLKSGVNPECDYLLFRANHEIKPFTCSPWLERMVQTFVSCVTTGNVKVQWNVCHALGNLFLNESVRLKDMTWAPSVYSILLLLLRDSSNFKIRIHAASALAVPSTREDYGNSFADVAQALGHTLETLDSDQDMAPSSFKYRKTLAEQLTSTTLHIFGLAVPEDNTSLNDFLIKRASFLEEWLRATYSSLMKDATHADVQSNGAAKEGFGEKDRETITMNGNYCLGYCTSYSEQQISSQNQPPNNCREDDVAASLREELMRKKESILRATRALINMYHCANQQSIIPKFEHLISQIS